MLSKPAITSPIAGAAIANSGQSLDPGASQFASLEEPYVAHPVVGFS